MAMSRTSGAILTFCENLKRVPHRVTWSVISWWRGEEKINHICSLGCLPSARLILSGYFAILTIFQLWEIMWPSGDTWSVIEINLMDGLMLMLGYRWLWERTCSWCSVNRVCIERPVLPIWLHQTNMKFCKHLWKTKNFKHILMNHF